MENELFTDFDNSGDISKEMVGDHDTDFNDADVLLHVEIAACMPSMLLCAYERDI